MRGVLLKVTALRFFPAMAESMSFSLATSMLLRHVCSWSAMSVTVYEAFSAGSSQQGNALLASRAGELHGQLRLLSGGDSLFELGSGRLASASRCDLSLLDINLVDHHSTFIFECFEVWLESQVVMNRLDILRQDLSALANVHVGIRRLGVVSAHPSMRAVSD
ncbi:hypothetical protein KC336_g93 [Hortaea werneckii]|nr:hypothetical protein KC336_g93 [Hortaea werneckii]